MGDNALELDVYIKLHTEDTDQAAFDDIKKAAQKAGKEVENAFNTAKIAAGIGSIVKAFGKLEDAIQKNITLTTKMTTTVVGSFGKMLASVTSFTAKLSGIPTILNGLKSVLTSVASSISSSLGAIDFLDLAKQSVELSSSLTEVKNVIDQVFGDGAKEVEEFTSTAITSLGMTTLAAEQYIGKFGAAMRSTGQSTEAIREMSKGLTQLTSDIASFYDIEQDIAAEKIFSGVISGMIKPMRTLGVDMTNASLNAWMLSKGLNATYESLDATSKQAIRYQYVMEKLNYVHGDYLRTIDSTANQFRLLKNQLKELGTVVGAIINKFLNPLIHVLNNIVAAVIRVAKVIAGLFGIDWQLGIGGSKGAGLSGVAEEYDGLADSADGLAESEDGLADSVSKAGKEAKKALAPFHKLNVLQNKASSGKSDLGGIGDYGAGLSDLSGLEDDFEAFALSFDDISKWLKDGLAKVLEVLDDFFATLPDKIQNFFDILQPWSKLLADLFMQIVEALRGALGYNIGKSISEVFEGIARTLNTFYDNINSIHVGDAIANILNGMVDNVDMFKEVFKLIGNAIESGFEMLKGFSEGFHWATLGENIYLGLKAGVEEINPDVIYDAIYSTLTGITTTLNEFFSNFNNDEELKQKIADSLLAVIKAGSAYLKNGGFKELVTNVADFIIWALETLTTELDKEENKKAVSEAIGHFLTESARVLSAGEDLAKVIWQYVSDALVQFFTNKDIPLPLKIVAAKGLLDVTGISDAISAAIISNLGMKLLTGKTGVGWIVTGLTKAFGGLKAAFSGWGAGAAAAETTELATAVETLSGDVVTAEGEVLSYGGALGGLKNALATLGQGFAAIAPYIAAAAAVLAEFFLGEAGVQKLLGYDIEGSTFAEKWNSFWGNFAEITTNAWNNTVSLFTEVIPGAINGLATAAGVGFDLLGQTIAEKLTALGAAIGEYFAPVREGFETAFYFLVGIAATVWEQIQAIWASVSQWFTDTVWTPIVTTAQSTITGISTFFTTLWANIQAIWGAVANWFLTTVWQPITATAQQLVTDIANFFTQLWADIQTVWSVVAEWFNTTIWIPLTTAVTTLKETVVTFFTEMWTSIQQIWGEVVSWFENSVWAPFKTAVEEAITVVEDGFGGAVDVIKEKWQGFLDFFEGLYNKIKGWLDDLVQKAKDFGTSMVNKGKSLFKGSSSSSSGIRGYAKGGVFMPNKPQLAILGDQTRGVNVESPLSTMVEAFRAAAADLAGAGFSGSITIPIYVDGVLTDQKVITASQMHNYRSNGR